MGILSVSRRVCACGLIYFQFSLSPWHRQVTVKLGQATSKVATLRLQVVRFRRNLASRAET